MLWDMVGLECEPLRGNQRMLAASLDVLTFALNFDNPACQESALHGLGHLVHEDKPRITRIVEDYLKRSDPTQELCAYANAAIKGDIL